MKITWLGHSGFIWESEGVRILIDPFLSGNHLPETVPVPNASLTTVSILSTK